MRKIITGIKNIEEAWYYIEQGVDGFGFVLEPKMEGYLDPELTRELILKLPPLVSTIGIFADTPRYAIQELTTFCRLDWLLFMGKETAKDCEDYGEPIIKFLPTLEFRTNYPEIKNFLIEAEEKMTWNKLNWQTKKIIYHHRESLPIEDSIYALYFETAEKRTK